MKIFYANRKIQFRHFSDLSALNGLFSAEDLKLRVPAQENFVIQFIVLPEKEDAEGGGDAGQNQAGKSVEQVPRADRLEI